MQPVVIFPKINLADFAPVPEPHRFSSWVLSFKPQGTVVLNEAFRRELKRHTDQLDLGFEISTTDPRIMRLFVTDNPNYRFSNSGSGKKDPALTRTLVERGITLPAHYEITWHANINSWIARSGGALVATAAKDSVGITRARNGAKYAA